MKIAFTADNHLTTLNKHPQRYKALVDIYNQCEKLDVQILVIAGDLFDQSMANYSDFEKVYRKSRPEGLKTIIIPGNHDHQLQQEAIAGEGLIVYSEPTLQKLNDSRLILFLPYQNQQSMGEGIAPFADQISNQRWILVSHGDWSAGQKTPDPYEKGSYMPLTGPDLNRYQPEMVFLGHIHLPQDDGKVYYPGSPCPIDISETGLRRFLVLDTQKGEVKSHPVNSSLIYFDESFTIIPTGNELDLLKTSIQSRIKDWNLPKEWKDQVQVRVQIQGSSPINREEIRSTVETCYASYRFYQDNPPSLDALIYSQDEDRAEIASQIQRWIDGLDWEDAPAKPAKTQILQKALLMIYKGQ